MKRIFCLILCSVLLFSLCACASAPTDTDTGTGSGTETGATDPGSRVTTDHPADPSSSGNTDAGTEPTEAQGAIPTDPKEFSPALAAELFEYCVCSSAKETETALTRNGYWVMTRENYGKSSADASHTCGYTLGMKGDADHPVLLFVLRGTASDGEWLSNFDLMSSGYDTQEYAENFMKCAEDVRNGTRTYLEQYPDAILLLCGYSRGAAAANLLGVLLDQSGYADRTYVYTFATPATVRGNAAKASYPNIFNVVNSADAVPMVPPATWGFVRAGTDIVLFGDKAAKEKCESLLNAIQPLCPTVSAYYTAKYATNAAGRSDQGVTVAELLPMLVSSAGKPLSIQITPESDLYAVSGLLASDVMHGGEMMRAITQQHMPDTYRALMANAAAE